MRLSTSVAQFVLAHDTVMLVGSASAARVPSAKVAVGLRVEDDGESLSFGIDSTVLPRFMDDLVENPQVAVNVTRVPDCASYQIKGRILSIEPADEVDHARARRYVDDLVRLLWSFNPLARERGAKPFMHIDRKVRIAVTSVFVQTPGPAAGRPVPA